ncbi:hypothetical protein ACWOC1_06585 [Enterococcus quebecensis]|uniref:Uncharacterized protein n=1 Tax=Enterococcus quebecensis TaxID=903983 RepID=A0A1E5GRV6_9ENTE|nr:hypothetical protein [Enterococcus quebecensis]OEG15427.1 hypothetical protein BCR23_08125 [Enterococcus quebecensis]OJG74078.1 hypothetical protein RV12_GL000426 [Enterococcus quebecensis]
MKSPKSPENSAEVNRQKQERLPKNQDSIRALIINDPTVEGSARYFAEKEYGEDTDTLRHWWDI